MYCDMNGDFKMVLHDSPGSNFRTHNISTNKQEGFIIADDMGRFLAFDSTSDHKNPFHMTKRLPEKVDKDEPWCNFLEKQDNQPNFPITSMAQVGDNLIYTTARKQLLKMKTSAEKQDDFGKIAYLSIPFHRMQITAMATCMKSNILVTGSLDKTICVWNYSAPSSSLQLKVCQTVFDEVRTLALHPSGMYMIVAFFDKIKFYNIHPDSIQ
jgi:WD40 repeat protein